MEVYIILPSILTALFVTINFIAYVATGHIIAHKSIWLLIQLWTVLFLPVWFLLAIDLPYKNDCCDSSAIFSPSHRLGIYFLIFLCIAAYVSSVFRKDIWPPIAELFLNSFLLLALFLNIIFCIQFTSKEDGSLWWIIGNIPIFLLLLIELSNHQKRFNYLIEKNNYSPKSLLGKICLSILKYKPIFKYSILTILLIPIIILISLFLILFGQKPDSMIRALTETYKHGFSQLDYMCDNVNCGGHFLCSVGANGHFNIVKPIRYGERNGNKIICTRQLLISNAFEDLLQEYFPQAHKIIRRNYNEIGKHIHSHYYIFNKKWVSDLVYIIMKPAEIFFLIVLYTFDKKPENRIAIQYLNKRDRQHIIGSMRD